MPAYIIAEIDVHDAATFAEYRAGVPETLVPFGGRFVVRGGRVETLEGDWSPSRLVILEFPSAAQAKAWWDSKEYNGLKLLRQAASTGKLLLVEGI
jgi:uncharacterized protein (DUF1330 family)